MRFRTSGFLQTAFPGLPPSDRLRFSRLQLRGSAGIAPASLSSPQGKDAQTEGHFKERKIVVREIYRGGVAEVKSASTKKLRSFDVSRSLGARNFRRCGPPTGPWPAFRLPPCARLACCGSWWRR